MKVYVRRHAAQQERLAAFAHDIRTPMTCAAGAAQMALAAGRQGRDVSAQLEQILLAVGAMDRLVSELCSQSARPDAAQALTEEKLRRELLAMIGESAREKDQLLEIDLSALGGRAFACDEAALVRVLTNLLQNAVKYTPCGGRISLKAVVEAGGLRFVVADNGMGMKEEFLEKLFKPFERARESAHLPGKGLGMSIVARLLERMGGRIVVDSRWGEGTRFDVYVPMANEKGTRS